MSQMNIKENRNKQRRHYGSATSFPLKDDRGCIVLFDRSRIVDRRWNNLVLDELEVEEVDLKQVNM